MSTTSEIVKKANHLLNTYHTRDPRTIASHLGITVIPQPFDTQKGAYKVILRKNNSMESGRSFLDR